MAVNSRKKFRSIKSIILEAFSRNQDRNEMDHMRSLILNLVLSLRPGCRYWWHTPTRLLLLYNWWGRTERLGLFTGGHPLGLRPFTPTKLNGHTRHLWCIV